MKKILFALVAMFMTVAASAQGFGGGQRMQMNPEDMAKRQADQVKEICQVNDDQYKKIYDYYLNESKVQVARMDSIRKANEGQQAQPGQGMRGGWNREEMQKRQEAQLNVLKGILTEEQFAAYQKAQEERRARMDQRGQGGQGGQGFGGGQRRQRQQQ